MLEIRSYGLAAMLTICTVLTSPAMAQPFGLVADKAKKSVNVFDTDTNSIVASLPIGPGSVGDTAITPDQTLGFATDHQSRVWVIDLMTSPPNLAMGTNPIPISNPGEDLSITPDGQFLLIVDALSNKPLSVIDIANRTEIDTFSPGPFVAVDVCDDGSSVLVSTFYAVRRLTIDTIGNLTDTGEELATDGALNVYCAPGSNSGVIASSYGRNISSFTIPGLYLVDTRMLPGYGNSAVFNPEGDRVFVRSISRGAVVTFNFDAAVGTLGATANDSVSVSYATNFFGMDQLGISADGDALYVPEGFPVNAVSVHDAANLRAPLLASITDTNILQPTGIALPSVNVVRFGDFNVVLELADDRFKHVNEFTLGASSNGIDPTVENVTLEIGKFSMTIPAGSFVEYNGTFEFEGVVEGINLDIMIELIVDSTYRFMAEGFDLHTESDPVTIVLTIGDDLGETTVAARP